MLFVTVGVVVIVSIIVIIGDSAVARCAGSEG